MLKNVMAIVCDHCPFGIRVGSPLIRAMINSPTAPKKRHRVRKCIGGISDSTIFIVGQFIPQPNVRPISSQIRWSGNVCRCLSLFMHSAITQNGGFCKCIWNCPATGKGFESWRLVSADTLEYWITIVEIFYELFLYTFHASAVCEGPSTGSALVLIPASYLIPGFSHLTEWNLTRVL